MKQLSSDEILKKVNDFLDHLPYDRKPASLYEPVQYVLAIGGKRIRPVLALLGYNLWREQPEDILMPAVGLETYHNYTLLHDDLMDKADLRRGQQTVHKKWNDNKAILSHGLTVLGEVIPNAEIKGFIRPVEAVEYAKTNRISLAVLDIELGTVNGLELCRSLLEINPCTNVVFLTAYSDYSLDAWKTGACGYILKPMTPESIKEQLKNLRYPLSKGGTDK